MIQHHREETRAGGGERVVCHGRNVFSWRRGNQRAPRNAARLLPAADTDGLFQVVSAMKTFPRSIRPSAHFGATVGEIAEGGFASNGTPENHGSKFGQKIAAGR